MLLPILDEAGPASLHMPQWPHIIPFAASTILLKGPVLLQRWWPVCSVLPHPLLCVSRCGKLPFNPLFTESPFAAWRQAPDATSPCRLRRRAHGSGHHHQIRGWAPVGAAPLGVHSSGLFRRALLRSHPKLRYKPAKLSRPPRGQGTYVSPMACVPQCSPSLVPCILMSSIRTDGLILH